MTDLQQAILLAVVIGLVIIVFASDWADRRRSQRTLDLLNDFISNPEVRKATAVSSDTPIGMTFVAPEPEPDPHVWITYFVGHEEIEASADWPVYVVEKWERNEINETRYLDSCNLKPDATTVSVVKPRSLAAE
jgi:hypothetical protein